MEHDKAKLEETENLRIWFAVLREKYKARGSQLDRSTQKAVGWLTPPHSQDGTQNSP